MLKGKSKPQDNGAGAEGAEQLRENPQVNAKIDQYIQNNPKHWQYIQSLPAERMARALVLNEVQKQERQEKMRVGIMKKLEQNPEMKRAYETLVKNLPEDQREKMMASLAARTMRSIAPRQNQQAPQPGVKV